MLIYLGMADDRPLPSTLGEGHYPVRAGDWLARGDTSIEIAQIKSVYVDPCHDDEFLVDLIIYDRSGNKLGRVSPVEPFVVLGKRYLGPRTFEPACSLEGWRRIKQPSFPIEQKWVKNAAGTSYSIMDVTENRPWGDYVRRTRAVVPAVVLVKPNFDAELEKRVLLMTAQNLRDIARETGNEELRQRAQELEKQADEMN